MRLPFFEIARVLVRVIASSHIILSLRIAKLLEENERRENEARRVRSLESIKP
jgi:hypothetical protein